MALTPAQQIAAADRAVLAQARADGASYEVVAMLKGDAVTSPITAPSGEKRAGTLVLVRPTPSAAWLVVGPAGSSRAELLRRIATTTPGDDEDDGRWSAHAAFMLPYLTDPEPLIASIAYGELARTPYSALRTLKPQLVAARYAGALDDPSRQALYTLLYGIGADDAKLIEQRIDIAWRAKDATNLAALLAADLEIRGPSRVAWIERHYFADRDRTLPEIQAALLALSVQGEADAAIPRARVIAAFRMFMKARKPMAGFVAQELAHWNYWDAGPEYVELLKANALPDPASRVAVMSYLLQSPRRDVKSAARAIASSSHP